MKDSAELERAPVEDLTVDLLPREHPQHTLERHRVETSDASAFTGGYYGIYDPREDVSADEKLEAAIASYCRIFTGYAKCAAMNPFTIAQLQHEHDIVLMPRYWIPADTFYIGSDERGLAP